jgi:hypothetical protein
MLFRETDAVYCENHMYNVRPVTWSVYVSEDSNCGLLAYDTV